MRHFFNHFALNAVVLFVMSTSVSQGVVTLDQQNVFPNPSIGDNSSDAITYGQTFTVGLEGTLSQVDVYLSRFGPTTEDLVFQLFSTDSNGLPLTQLGSNLTLAPANVSTTVPDFEIFDVSAFNIDVEVGDVLSFVITKNPNVSSFGYILPFSTTQLYSGGQPVQRIATWSAATGATRDYGFRTYVDVIPEPGVLSMIAISSITLLRRRRYHAVIG